jgi:hypothetical protein
VITAFFLFVIYSIWFYYTFPFYWIGDFINKKNLFFFGIFPWKKTEREDIGFGDARRWKFSLSLTHSKTLSYTKREVCNFNFVEIVCLDLSKIPKFSLSWLELNKLVSKLPSFNLKKILLGFALITYMSASLSILNWVSLVLSVYVCVCVVTWALLFGDNESFWLVTWWEDLFVNGLCFFFWLK